MDAYPEYVFDELADDEIRLLQLCKEESQQKGKEELKEDFVKGYLVTCQLPPENTLSTPITGRVASDGYDAISYHQGSKEKPSTILIEDPDRPKLGIGRLAVPLNTELALKCFRGLLPSVKDLQYIWIDTVCINQDDKAEKAVQIANMNEVYRQAKNVRVWLGQPIDPKIGQLDDPKRVAMEFILELGKFEIIDELSTDKSHISKWLAFMDLMRCQYFNRRWIIQEIALARSAYVHYGDKMVGWKAFKMAVGFFTAKAPQLKKILKDTRVTGHDSEYLGETDALGAKALVHLTDNMFHKTEEGEIFDHLFSLETLMSALTMFETSNPFDLIYAILWLAHDTTPAANERRPSAQYVPPSRGQTPIPPASEGTPDSERWEDALSEPPSPFDLAEPYASLLPPSTLSEPPLPRSRRPSLFSGPLLGPGDLPDPKLADARAKATAVKHSKKRAETGLSTEPTKIEVNYDIPIFQVCSNFLHFTISRSKSLDIICQPWAPFDPAEQAMPSWIQTVEKRTHELMPKTGKYVRRHADSLVGNVELGIRPYRACGKKKAFGTDSGAEGSFISDRSLIVKGFILDEIGRVCEGSEHGNIQHSWLKLAEWTDFDTDPPEEFWRTLVADRDFDKSSPPPVYFPGICKWAFREHKGRLDTKVLLDPYTCPELAVPFLRRVQAVTWNRSMVLTKPVVKMKKTPKPLLALAPSHAEPGDLICVLFGCSVPIVLRNTGKEPSQSTITRRQTSETLKSRSTLPVVDQPSHASSNVQQGALFADTIIPLNTELLELPGSLPSTSPQDSPATPSSSTRESVGLTPLTINKITDAIPTFVISQAKGEQFEFIGECYVHGMMNGEAFKHREDTGYPVREFCLV